MKFSANIPDEVLSFLDEQVATGRYRSRSAALTDAIVVWRESRLGEAYRLAFSEDEPVWDGALGDGWGPES